MDHEEAARLETTSLRKQGKSSPFSHPDVYRDAGSVLTLDGVDWYVPPLYPSGCTTFVPTFTEEGVEVITTTDGDIADETLSELAEKICEMVTIKEIDVCETCLRPQRAMVSMDAVKDNTLMGYIFQYAKICIGKLYDVSNENLSQLLRFTKKDTLPLWVTQVIDHAHGTEGK